MAETEGSTWPALIPEFYYDLISRIPPGTLLLLLLIYELLGVEGRRVSLDLVKRGQLEGIPFAGLFILAIAGGYALGILISPLGYLVRRLYIPIVWRRLIKSQPTLFNSMCQAYDAPATASSTPAEDAEWLSKLCAFHYLKVYRLMHDHLKALDPQPRVMLPKMSAEAALCENLVAVALLWLLLLLVTTSPTLSIKLVLGILLAALLAFFAGFHRYRQSVARHFSFFRLQQSGVFKHAG